MQTIRLQINRLISPRWQGAALASIVILILLALLAIVPTAGLIVLAALTLGGVAYALALRPYLLLAALTLFMPLEPVLLSFLPVSSAIYGALQFVAEALIYLLLGVTIARRLLRRQPLVRTPLEVPLIAFALISVISTVLGNGSLVDWAINLRKMFRYVALFYAVLNMDLSRQKIDGLLKLVLASGVAQLILGGAQIVAGTGLDMVLAPRAVDVAVGDHSRNFQTLLRGREIGAIYGTLGDTIHYGQFLLVFMAIYLGRWQRFRWLHLAVIAAVFIGIGYSYSRSAVFAFFVMLLVFFLLRVGWRRAARVLLPLGAVGAIGIAILFAINAGFTNPRDGQQSIFQNITGIFSQQYIQNALQYQRLGVLTRTLPTVLIHRPLLGYGLDTEHTTDMINAAVPTYQTRVLDRPILEDVYWVALVAQVGIVGTAIIIALGVLMVRVALGHLRSQSDPLLSGLSIAVICYLAAMVFMLFFNQVLEFRVQSYFLWLLPALMFSAARLGESDHSETDPEPPSS